MKILVTGSSGHLGEALIRRLRNIGHDVIGLDLTATPFTTRTGSITDRSLVQDSVRNVQAIIHTATLHKPHVKTHSRQDFVDTNITGTLNLLEEAVAAEIKAFVFTSTTSVFGDALRPPEGAAAAWITEDVTPITKNIYGMTKFAAEDLCALFHRRHSLPCIILRTSRFFPEEDDSGSMRERYSDDNLKTNELLFRRVDIDDAVGAHLLAMEKAPRLGFGRYIISATTPFLPEDLAELRNDAEKVVQRRVPHYQAEYRRRNWTMLPAIDRVYVNARARQELGWQPSYDFHAAIDRLKADKDPRSALARTVGKKGYHDRLFEDGPYPVD